MNCPTVQKLLHAHLDDELTLLEAQAVEEHLQTCPDCAQALRALQSVKAAVSQPGVYHAMPPALRDRIAAMADLPRESPRRFPWRVLSLAASVMLAAGVGFALLGPLQWNRQADEIAASHIRSLQADHLMDVPSTDQHTVKPWFDGKLDFAPPVHDLAADGFPLAGGRLDYLDHRPVAALVYRRDKHIINLFIWPASCGDQEATRQGYNLIRFPDGEMTCWAASDLNMAELERFTHLFLAAK